MEPIEIDIQIIQKYKATGEKQLLNPLFKKYSQDLFGIAYYYLSDRDRAMDVVMDVYETVLKSIDEKEITNYRAWILSICRNTCLKRIRDHKSYVELSDFSENFMESETELEYSDELIDQLLDFIKELQRDQRICVEAFYLNGKSYAEISSTFQYTLKEVKSYIQNGKRNLLLMFGRLKNKDSHG